jgi:hypothetical protein
MVRNEFAGKEAKFTGRELKVLQRKYANLVIQFFLVPLHAAVIL